MINVKYIIKVLKYIFTIEIRTVHTLLKNLVTQRNNYKNYILLNILTSNNYILRNKSKIIITYKNSLMQS